MTESNSSEVAIQSQILANMVEGICLIRAADTTIVYCNAKLQRMLGNEPGELVEQPYPWMRAGDAHGTDHPLNAIRQKLEAQGSWEDEVRLHKKDGTPFWAWIGVSTFDHAEHGPVWVMAHRDISERRQREFELKRVYDMPRAMIMLAKIDSTIVQVSAGSMGILGYPEAEMVGRSFFEFIHPDDIPDSEAEADDVYDEGETLYFENRYRHAKGNYRTLAWAVSIDSETGFAYGFAQDITERLEAEEALREAHDGLEARVHARTQELASANENLQMEISRRKQIRLALEKSERLYRQLIESMNEGLGILDERGNITYANDAFCKMLGFTPDELVGMGSADLFDDENKKILKQQLSVRSTGENTPYEIAYRAKNGDIVPTIMSPRAIMDEQGQHFGSFAVITDITERKRAEQEIRTSLREKEILLKEIHHRVKNNLQIIVGLLHLQQIQYEDEKTKRALQESKHRVQAMALLHEKLYQSEKLSRIEMGDYLEELKTHLVASYGTQTSQVAFTVSADKIHLEIDQAIPLGLILTELLSNSLKYAFPNERKGSIEVNMTAEGNEIKMNIGDDGVGVPSGTDIAMAKTLGLKLVRNLVNQLEGDLEVDTTNGVSYSITFQRQKLEEGHEHQ